MEHENLDHVSIGKGKKKNHGYSFTAVVLKVGGRGPLVVRELLQLGAQ